MDAKVGIIWCRRWLPLYRYFMTETQYL